MQIGGQGRASKGNDRVDQDATSHRLTTTAIAALGCAAASAVIATGAQAANVSEDGGFESASPTANESLDSPS